MKTQKLTMAFIAIFLFSNLIWAINPQNGSKNNESSLLKELCNYINLTDSQKNIIQYSATSYEAKLKKIKIESNVETRKKMIKNANIEYFSFIDSILSPEQKDSFKLKRIHYLAKKTH